MASWLAILPPNPRPTTDFAYVLLAQNPSDSVPHFQIYHPPVAQIKPADSDSWLHFPSLTPTMPPLELSRKAAYVPHLSFGTVGHHNGDKTLPSPWTTAHSYLPFGWPPKPPRTPIKQESSGGRRHVQFAHRVRAHGVLHFRDYTTEEMENTWYNKEELMLMKRNCKTEAALVTASDYEKELVSVYDHQEGPLGDISNSYHYQGMESTVRGLENKTEMGASRKKRIRSQAWKAVFAEQRWQNRHGHSDPDTLADVYFQVSEPCHVVANMVGLRDAREVQSMDQEQLPQEPVEGSEKENQRIIGPSNNSGVLSDGVSRQYQRLIVIQQKAQSRRDILRSAA